MTKKVLIVDGEPNIVMSLEFLMQKAGFAVAVAYDGAEALIKIAQFNPELILLDAVLPKKSGYEICAAVRADAVRAATKILMLSTRGRPADVAKGLALGADAYVVKPFSTKDLLMQANTLLADA
jgi:DNA-binding response OmpR family regulator